MTEFRIHMRTPMYHVRQELLKIISEREIMYEFGIEGDELRFVTVRDITLSDARNLVPDEYREFVDGVRLVPQMREEPTAWDKSFKSAYDLYHINK